MTGVFDIIGLVGYSVGCIVLLHGLFAKPNKTLWPARLYALGAMSIMLVVSTGNAFQSFGITDALATFEEYGEVMFLPLLAYMTHSLYVRTVDEKVEHEHSVVTRLGDRLNESMAQMGEHRLGMLRALSAAVDERDHYTAQHSLHVADYACAIGYRLGMTEDLMAFEQAGLLHDIGKIGIPDAILLKSGSLSTIEYETIQGHADGSARIIETIPFLSDVVDIVRHHHERWDGKGYPDGLAGEDIPRAARILAVADAFDAMTTDRPYRSALSVAEARAALMAGRGTQWDPEPVDTLLDLLDEEVISVKDAEMAA